MAAFNFPNSPSVNDIHSENGVSFKWNGTMWNRFGPAYTDTANLNVTGIGTFAGAVNIGGVLTYEDVKNVDSVGIVTARGGLNVTANTDTDTLNVSGISTFGGHVYIPEYIIHSGDTNTWFRFPSDDTITLGTGGSERVRIDSSGRLLIGTTTEGYVSADNLTVADSGNAGITIRSGTGNLGTLSFSDGTSGAAEYDGYIQYSQPDQYMDFGGAGGNIRLRIDSSGRVLIGTTTEGHGDGDNLTIRDSGNCGITIRSSDVGWGTIYFSDATSGAGEYDGFINYSQQNRFLKFGTASTERLRITSAGLVQIGLSGMTGGDDQGLVVNNPSGDNKVLELSSSNASGRINFSRTLSNTLNTTSYIEWSEPGAQGTGDLRFGTSSGSNNPTERLRIRNDGIIQIGNTENPTNYNVKDIMLGNHSGHHGITILSGTSNGGYIMFSDNNGGGSNAYRGQIEYQHNGDYMRFITATGERLRISSDGKMGLGLSDATHKLHMVGGSTVLDTTNNGYGGLKIYDDSGGDYHVRYVAGRNQGATAHVFMRGGRTQNQTPWADATATEHARIHRSGISFGGDTADANTLNDYEEGSFTPIVLNGWGVLSSSPDVNTGKYVRIGALVYIYFSFKEGSGNGSFNGNRLSLYQFPYQAEGQWPGSTSFSHPLQAYTNSASSGGEDIIGVPSSNGATIFSFLKKTSSGYTSFTGSDLGSSGQIFCAGVYRINGT